MSKLQEKIEFYSQQADKLGIELETELFAKVTKGMGPSLYRQDAEKVSCSQKSELLSIKKNFLIKKLGLEDSEKLDAVIKEVCEQMGKSNRNKYRAIFYYLLVVKFDKATVYTDTDKKKKVEKAATEKKESKKKEAKTKEDDEEKEKPKKKKTEKKSSKKEASGVTDKIDEEKPTTPQEFLDNFDWHKYEEGIEEIDEAHLKEFEVALEGTLGFVNEREVIEGMVIRITDRDAIIDINSKSEGVVSLNEFRYNPHLKVGDKVEVLVDKREDSTGQLVLSHRKARTVKAWDRVNHAYDSDEVITGFVKCRTRGGMIVDVFGIEAFLPGSQIDIKPIHDYDQYVEKNMEFKIVKINHEFKNVVVSHKILIEAGLEEQKKEIISQLEKGQVLEGIVKNITNYGAFVDLGGVDGLVHITDLSWNRVSHPSEMVELDQTINVVILDFDKEKSRIQLGMKQLVEHPWEAISSKIKVGDKIKGKVVVIADYGVFVEIAEGVEGLVHVSEMSWSTHLRSASDFVEVGDVIDLEILSLNLEERKMSLGMKQLIKDPWSDITEKYPVGSEHIGKVRNYTNFGVFVELEEGIDGLVYISDLSWTKKIKHPSDFINIGDKLKVKVLELNVEDRRLNLGHKQTVENPWDEYEKTFKVGSKHTGIVEEKVDKGAIISLAKDIEAFVPGSHMTKEDGSKLNKGDEAEFTILEFNKDYRRIVVSHMATYKEEEEKVVKAAAKKVEKTDPATLGDVNKTLAGLKDKMEKKK